MNKGYSLMRHRRKASARNENWFYINQSDPEKQELLSNPSSKVLEKQERNYKYKEQEKKEHS